MSFEHLQKISSESLYFESFKRTSFIETVARWSKIFCYGFLFLTILGMALQMIFPFGVYVPDLFMQLLFLLIFWGTIEVLSLPLEYISDQCIVDFEKSRIAISEHRFFYKKIKILATFNQIKAIGVSARPPGITDIIFSKSEKRYAIFFQNFENQLFQISNYCLSLDEANSFCHRIYSTHFAGACYIGGEPGMEIFIDPKTNEILARQAERSIASLIDSVSLPVFQSVLAFMITSIVLNLSLTIIEGASIKIFSTDLQIHRQPVFQLITGIKLISQGNSRQPKNPTLQKPEPPKLASATTTIKVPFPGSETASFPVKIDLTNHKIIEQVSPASSFTKEVIATNATFTARETAPATPPLLPLTETSHVAISEATTSSPFPVQTEKTIITETAIPASTTTSIVLSASTSVSPIPPNLPSEAEYVSKTVIEKQPTNKRHTEAPKAVYVTPEIIDAPIPSRIPDVNIITALQTISSEAFNDTSTIANSISKPAQKIAKKESTTAIETCLLPGYGLHSVASIGNYAASVVKKCGNPIAKYRAKKGWQLIYADFTLLTNNEQISQITTITVTKKYSQHFGLLSTPQGITIGSKTSEVKAKYGPHTIIKSNPGLHYPRLGISFIPSPSEPQLVGAIQIYEADNRNDLF